MSASFGEDAAQRMIEVPIAQHALIQWGSPYHMGEVYRVEDLRLVGDTLVWHDEAHILPHHLPLHSLVWASGVHADGDERRIYLHAILRGRYRILGVDLHPTEMGVLRRIVRGLQSQSQPYLIMPPPPQPAHIATQDWAGALTLGAPVMLYLLPHRLIVLHQERVSAQINLTSLRRILAIEGLPQQIVQHIPAWLRLWAWVGRRKPEGGLLRLHSAGETALFITTQYAQMAHDIAQSATCAAEFIARDDKKGK